MSQDDRLEDLLNPDPYESRVLRLERGRTERQIDDQCTQDAITLGLKQTQPEPEPEPPKQPETLAPESIFSGSSGISIRTLSSPSCRSSSSTAYTSIASQTTASQDYDDFKPPMSALLRPGTAYCRPLNTQVRPGPSSTPASPPAAITSPTTDCSRSKSTTSVPSVSSVGWSPRVLAHRLKFRRFSRQRSSASSASSTGTTACRMCDPTSPPSRKEHRLLCGHRLCSDHLHKVVLDESSVEMREEVRDCCARSIPWAAAQTILEQTTSGQDESVFDELREDSINTGSSICSYPSSSGMSKSDMSGPATPRTSEPPWRQSGSDLSHRPSAASSSCRQSLASSSHRQSMASSSHRQSVASSSHPQSLASSSQRQSRGDLSHRQSMVNMSQRQSRGDLSHRQSMINISQRQSLNGSIHSQHSQPAPPTPPPPINLELTLRLNLEKAMKFPDFRSLRRKQEEERDRFQEYLKDHRALLKSRQEEARCQMLKRHASATAELIEQHPPQLLKLEERQLEAELCLKESHVLESRTCLVALRHMEGYCQGHDPTGTGRNVTLQDRMKLERQYHTWRHLGRRQETAINILREQQARQMKARAAKQKGEVSALVRTQESEVEGLERVFEGERKVVEELFEGRKERMVKRWEVAFETWRSWRGKEEHIDVPEKVAPVAWIEVAEEGKKRRS